MALLYMEGFEGYTNGAEIIQRQGVTSNLAAPGGVFDIITGRITGNGFRIDTSNDWVQFELPTASTATQWLGFAIQYPTAPDSDAGGRVMVQALDVDKASIWELYYVNGGALDFRRGGTSLGTTSQSIGNSWVYVEVSVFVHDSTGTVTIKFDGTTVLNLTSQDTKAGSNDATKNIRWHGRYKFAGDPGDLEIDDFIFGDNSGTDQTTHPGDCHIEMLLPDGDGATNNFTAVGTGTTNADRVDDATQDGDTTYVHSSTNAHKDLYTFANMTETPDTVYAVQVMHYSRKENAGYRTMSSTIRSNVTEVDSTALPVGTDYVFYDGIFENNPDGGGAWTESAVNAMQCGIEIKS